MSRPFLLSTLGIFLLITENVYAYLDPGTGSMLLQGLVAAIAGGLVVIKLYWHKVRMFFSGHRQQGKSSAASVPDSSNEEDGRVD